MNATEYQVTGMTCGHCEMSVREEVSTVPGVQDIEVSAETGELIVTSAEPIDEQPGRGAGGAARRGWPPRAWRAGRRGQRGERGADRHLRGADRRRGSARGGR